MLRAAGCLLVVALLAAPRAAAQVAFSNLAIALAGNVPYTLPENRTDLYDQFQADALLGALRLGGRLEIRENSERRLTYREITQRYAEWRDQGLSVRVGNLYTLTGRGLIQRAFELPGVVIDQPGTRSEFGFSRDIDGVLAEGRWGPLEARGYGGTPNGGTASASPDEFQSQYEGQVTGGQLGVDVWRGARVGAGYARTSVVNAFVDRQDELGTGFAEFDPLRLVGLDAVALPLYAEYAQLNRSFGQWWSLERGDRVPHALYVSSNLIAGPVAISAEWKDYRRFRLGTNDPPSLVREHAFALLNRATHVLEADGEHGFQVEGSWALPGWGSLIANRSRADGTSTGSAQRYFETYLEWRAAPEAWTRSDLTVFVDRSQDQFSRISERLTWGGTVQAIVGERWAVSLDLERSDATRYFAATSGRRPASFTDQRATLGVSRAGWGSAALIGETSSDPSQRSSKRPDADRRFFAGTVTAQLSDRHTATLLAGERRGGRACTAGTCYEVQDFRGVELRLATRY